MLSIDYVDALDIHARTAKHVARPGGWSEVIGGGVAISQSSKGGEIVGSAGIQSLQMIVERGETYFVSPTMTEVIFEAARALPGNWSFHEAVIPSDAGLCIHPFGPRTEPNISRRSFTAFGWRRATSSGFFLAAFYEEFPYRRLLPGRTIFWKYGVTIDEAVETSVQTQFQTLPQSVTEDEFRRLERLRMNFCACVMQWMNDKIIVTRTRSVPRAAARRAAQSFIHEPVVNVVELRARQYETVEREGDVQHRDYAVRWIVRGHWRNQWYPSLGRHQPKWITPYVKGPEDKPLKTPRASVFAVVR